MNESMLRYFFLFCAFFMVEASFALPTPNTHVLKNGLTLLHLQDPRAPVVILQVWYRVGSQDEPLGKTGLSHMLEHVMYKGTHRFGPGESSRLVAEMGGDENAFTARDYTGYYQIVPKENLDQALMIEADRMSGLKIIPKEFEKERLVVLEERRQRIESSPFGFALHYFNQLAFQNTPYHQPVIGWLHDIKKWRPQDALNWYKKYYHPANAFVVIVGDIDLETSKKLVEKHFGPKKAKKNTAKRNGIQTPVFHRGAKSLTVKNSFKQTYLLQGFNVPSIQTENTESYALDILAEALGGGTNGYLYEKLVLEKALATTVAVDYDLLAARPSQFLIYAEPTPGTPPEKLKAELQKSLIEARSVLGENTRLQRARIARLSSLIFSQDSLFEVARLIGHIAILNLPNDFLTLYQNGIEKVEPLDLLKVYDKYIRPSNATTVTLTH